MPRRRQPVAVGPRDVLPTHPRRIRDEHVGGRGESPCVVFDRGEQGVGASDRQPHAVGPTAGVPRESHQEVGPQGDISGRAAIDGVQPRQHVAAGAPHRRGLVDRGQEEHAGAGVRIHKAPVRLPPRVVEEQARHPRRRVKLSQDVPQVPRHERRVNALRQVGVRRQVVDGVAKAGQVGQRLAEQRQFRRGDPVQPPIRGEQDVGGPNAEVANQPSPGEGAQGPQQPGVRLAGRFRQRGRHPGAVTADRERVADQAEIRVQGDDEAGRAAAMWPVEQPPDGVVALQRPLTGQISVKILHPRAAGLRFRRILRRPAQEANQFGGGRLRRQEPAVFGRQREGHGRSRPRSRFRLPCRHSRLRRRRRLLR